LVSTGCRERPALNDRARSLPRQSLNGAAASVPVARQTGNSNRKTADVPRCLHVRSDALAFGKNDLHLHSSFAFDRARRLCDFPSYLTTLDCGRTARGRKGGNRRFIDPSKEYGSNPPIEAGDLPWIGYATIEGSTADDSNPPEAQQSNSGLDRGAYDSHRNPQRRSRDES